MARLGLTVQFTEGHPGATAQGHHSKTGLAEQPRNSPVCHFVYTL